ncbi:MAG TPA: nuclear pore complex subunit [Marinilabiliales bacterium]|jgi:hypothetical protein|nr:DUF1987 domain-containing protein [Salinivirgaceae bacterium]OFX40742.1 MAG: hypothetical protein A2W95_08860 [Bacteroidetes bacterium GWA2_40_14]OFX65716.1 MAG: hypothetical protein A2W84_15915 [Bacteroidetes bacterium GWC2_40_13]OFX75971.1 MAG: hypothetical protein A2W96_00770 [Bacteroidetes bacterium GWD2_40_43]OFX94415.1 MAG: hypothetical protein A2W97_19850 [Bacteroidetes bacterium GWE2_40_63]OFY18893.1 MAG: hypothetical protein A2W88_06620 [Bacteroidetes bacterium GWF2_40_13]OFZ28882
MEKFIIDHTEDTPKVVLDAESGLFSIEGRSLPENAVAFYQPIFNWLTSYEENSKNPIAFHFKLEYFNTASSKQITKLLLILQQMAQKITVSIKWYYYKEDADIKASGSRFAKLIKADIDLIPYE